jgi:hypothetical protein
VASVTTAPLLAAPSSAHGVGDLSVVKERKSEGVDAYS